MSYRTWLRDAKHLCDLGPFADRIPDESKKWTSEWEEQQTRKARRFFQQEFALDSETAKYFKFGLHDSGLADAHREGDAFKLSLDWFNGRVFADHLAWLIKVTEPPGPWLIEVHAEGCSYVRWARTLRHGDLTFSRPTFQIGENARNLNGDIQLSWAYATDGRKQLVFLCRTYQSYSSKQQDPLVLMIDCASVRVVNRCLPKLIKHFGPKVELLWNDAMNSIEFPHEEQLWACLDFGDYLEKRMEFHGLKAADLMPTQENQPQ